jgi:hypothetical protein
VVDAGDCRSSGEERRRALDAAHRDVLAAQAAFLHLLGEFAADLLHRVDGCRTLGSWLCEAYGYDAPTAARLARAAEAVAAHAPIGEALADGRLTPDHAAVLAKHPAPVEHLDLACEVTARQLDEQILAKPEPDPTGQEQAAATSLRASINPRTGMGTITIRQPLDAHHRAMEAIERLARQQPRPPDGDPGHPLPWRLALAFGSLCSATIAADADPDRATISSVTDLDVAHGWIDGRELPSETVRRLACGGRWELIVLGPKGVQPWSSPVTGDPSPQQRRRVLNRDGRRCRFPSCGGTWLQHLHHLVHREHGGPHVDDNLVPLCPYHHHLVHEGGWTTTGTATTLRFHRPDGTQYRSRSGPLAAA